MILLTRKPRIKDHGPIQIVEEQVSLPQYGCGFVMLPVVDEVVSEF